MIRGIGERISTVAASAAAIAALAPAAVATTGTYSLKITVPAEVHPHEHYVIKIAGTFPTGVHGVYLIAFLQYSGHSCKSTAQAEQTLPSRLRQLDAEQWEPGSPFTHTTHWTAGKRIGTRRLCAYLYAHILKSGSKARPLTRASKSYRDI